MNIGQLNETTAEESDKFIATGIVDVSSSKSSIKEEQNLENQFRINIENVVITDLDEPKNQEQENQSENTDKESINFLNVIIQPPVKILEKIVRYLRDVELAKAEDHKIPTPNNKIENAFTDIREIAWKRNWSDCRFFRNWAINQIRDRESIIWNENMGFIFPVSFEELEFLSELLHHYFIVEHAFYNYKGKEIQKNECDSKEKIINMFNGYCKIKNRLEYVI